MGLGVCVWGGCTVNSEYVHEDIYFPPLVQTVQLKNSTSSTVYEGRKPRPFCRFQRSSQNTARAKRNVMMMMMMKCCFTSIETVGLLLGTGAQDSHLAFHTTPEL